MHGFPALMPGSVAMRFIILYAYKYAEPGGSSNRVDARFHEAMNPAGAARGEIASREHGNFTWQIASGRRETRCPPNGSHENDLRRIRIDCLRKQEPPKRPCALRSKT